MTKKEMRNAKKKLVGIPEGKRLLGKSRCRWEVNLKWILQK
jgi:hypothetical protein